jgi:O-antigen/teichoic acid export membrane protein
MTSPTDIPESPEPRRKGGFLMNVLRAVGLRVVLMVVNLAIALILARVLGPEQYGIYVFAFAIMTLIALPGQAGMPLINVREVSFRLVDRDWAGVLGVVVRTRQLILGYSVFAGLGVAAVCWFVLADRLSDAETDAILWSVLLLPAFVLVAVTGASLRGLKHLLLGQFVETLFRPLLFLILVGGVVVLSLGLPLDASDAMMVHAIGAVLAVGAALVLQHRILAPKTQGLTPVYDTRTILKSIAPLTMIAGMQLIIGKTDILMLRVMRSPEEVGYYQVALQWANLALFAQQAVLMVSGPSVARAYRKEDMASVQHLLTSSARLVFLGALPLSIALLLFGEAIIRLSFGAEYIPAAAALSVLILGRVIQASYGAIIQLCKMVGWEGLMLRLVAVSALLNVVLNYLLIPDYGIVGAAIAGIVASFFWKTALMVLCWRRLGLVSFPFGGRPASLIKGGE